MKLRNELEAEQMQQQQWELSIQQLKQNCDLMAKQHEQNMQKIKDMALEANKTASSQAVAWLQTQLPNPKDIQEVTNTEPDPREVDPQKQLLLERLQKQQEEMNKQQEDIKRQIADIMAEGSAPQGTTSIGKGINRHMADQELLMEQLRASLTPKEATVDPNKALLKALITSQNKTTGFGGTSTLRPGLLHKLTGESEFSMAEWLASLNKQEEGESEINKLLNRIEDDDCRAECKHSKMRSGMLDKCSTNIRRKEVWPQKNLGEDWAEEEIEFKQLRFEHLVAGETRTIETCSDPAQILGRLKLLR